VRQPCRQQAQGRHHQAAHHQLAVLQHITQGHDEQQPQAITDLRERDDPAGQAQRDAGALADQADQRLRVVQVGHDQAAATGQQQGQPARQFVVLMGGIRQGGSGMRAHVVFSGVRQGAPTKISLMARG